jgi:hypothetical protein
MRLAISMTLARPAFGLPPPVSTVRRTGIELIDRASADVSGIEPENELL